MTLHGLNRQGSPHGTPAGTAGIGLPEPGFRAWYE